MYQHDGFRQGTAGVGKANYSTLLGAELRCTSALIFDAAWRGVV